MHEINQEIGTFYVDFKKVCNRVVDNLQSNVIFNKMFIGDIRYMNGLLWLWDKFQFVIMI